MSALARVAVLIVSYNTVEALRGCLGALAGEKSLHIVVVDNGSSDGSPDMVRREYPQATLVVSQRNLGFGAGVNLAAGHTDRAFLQLLNPDCAMPPGDIATLAARLEDEQDLGFVGPKIMLTSGIIDHACLRADPDPLGAALYLSRLPRLFPRNRHLNRYSLSHLDYDAEQDLLAGTAAALMVRAAAFHQVGGFDEAFFMYGEDLDLCRRLRQAGFRGRYVPSARAQHRKGEASRQQSRRMLVEFHRAMWIYYRKHEKSGHSPPLNWAVAAGIAAVAGARIGLDAVRRDKRVSNR